VQGAFVASILAGASGGGHAADLPSGAAILEQLRSFATTGSVLYVAAQPDDENLIGFRNRLAVLASWAWNYIRKDRSIRIIARSEADPLTEELETGRGTPPRETRTPGP